MLDEDFCVFLEYEICKAFRHSDNDHVKGIWCDGILLNQADITYSQKFVKENKQVTLKAFLGEDGQTVYELILKFGPKSLNRYARNLDIKECVPSPHKQNWFAIDLERNEIEIQLD